MYIKPRAGLKVFDPVRKQFMPEEGMEVDEHDLYWARRLRDRDVERTTAPGAGSKITVNLGGSAAVDPASKGGK